VTWEFPKNVVPEYLLHYEKDIRVYDVSPLGQFAASRCAAGHFLATCYNNFL
jgi:hypothetical protein